MRERVREETGWEEEGAEGERILEPRWWLDGGWMAAEWWLDDG